MRILIGDIHGQIIASPRWTVRRASWELNGIGSAELYVSTRDPWALPEILRFGNRILIYMPNGLPAWGGVLDPPMTWRNGEIAVRAYGIESLLKGVLTDRGRYFDGASVGAIFRAILQEAHADEMGITIGEVWMGGGLHSPAYHLRDLWWIISESLHGLEGCDVAFIPQERAGRIVWTASLMERRGSDRSDSVTLSEGRNIADGVSVSQQGPIYNEIVAIGAGTSWGEERPIITARDEASVSLFGRRQQAVLYSGASELATLEANATEAVRQNAWPRMRFTLPVLDAEPGRWRVYDLGDAVRLRMPSVAWGYDGRVRVLAREWREGNTCRLVVEEFAEARPISIITQGGEV